VFTDRCPHRGAKLSLGRVEGAALTCWYHGWSFDSSGQCISIPSEGGQCSLAGEVKVRSYPAEEHGGVVFAYMSSDGREPHMPCPNPVELESPEWSGFIVHHVWERCSWLRVIDNLTDPVHGTFLHSGAYSLGKGARHNIEMVLEDLPDHSAGFLVARKNQRGVDLDAIEYHFPNWIRTDIPYPPAGGPGGPMRIVGYITPIDGESTAVYFFQKRHITGWKWALWKLLWKLNLRSKAFGVVNQDRLVLQSQRGLSARDNEYLAASDVGVVRMRRMLHQEWLRQRSAGQSAEAAS
jgi:phenylpropionate dioxygenase-like ring-hydroxylating dioxygenase large terminal subunit